MSGHICRSCSHFRNAAADIERALPGMTSMSSAYADVRAQDGLCLRHDLMLRATASCNEHHPANEHLVH